MLAGIELDVSRGSLASIFRFGARRGLMSLAVAAFTSSFQRVIAHDLFGQRENVPSSRPLPFWWQDMAIIDQLEVNQGLIDNSRHATRWSTDRWVGYREART
ncbi:hypothetical protein F441_03051 [Phytophthora nicotianae CJ01A1]|uniref:Uncharacterized protein n=4 Tax=Phytophthora nicotianae TaxID=4792 RepID=V9FTH4_PHYNI|nr:hypothetical protein F443_03076 [Phytophthora nicotianae P1569]ETK93907.1 hypothetical protein L915_02943 [Phytophthora nicotianae]ETO82750.1 hypothetical protein F444_03118 [Phytophthora nicotianae P1976]ETP23855.1 hypothetical protein F441_03051 [Phytophthora nicotianae CJ01A1]ETM00400.1 hypothetical protein L917_02844 [Phytophthora nicotianae]